MSRPTVFISYSHKDEKWKDLLITQLGVLQQQGLLEVWDDRRIGAGEGWYEEIQAAMNRASVALLLVSADFLTSNFILREEVPRLLERREKEGMRLFPVLVRPCNWPLVPWLAPLQIRPKDARPLSGGTEHQIDADLTAIAEEVWAILNPTVQEAAQAGYFSLPPEKLSLAKLPSTSPDLFGRDQELALLDDAWAGKPHKINLVSLVAFGGVGKTALVNRWLLNLGLVNFRGAQRVLGWSFYSQGAAEGKQASADYFIDYALRWFGDPDPDRGTPWEKGERLAELVRKQRTLLILDGLEPLQYPPGEMGGRLRDAGLQSLLRELAHHNPGLCIITTRLAVDDLKDFVGQSLEEIDLEKLSPEAGAELLQHQGVQGSPEELRQASRDFGGHALALTLLGTYLTVAFKGDVRQRDKIPALLQEPERGGHARRVLASYETWFAGKPELEILYLLGLFDRPAEAGALQVLRAPPPLPGLTDQLQNLSPQSWGFALHHLRQARLLAEAEPDQPEALDCHPLVREHFGELLQESNLEAWREAHGRLYDYYKSQVEEYPDTLEGLTPLYRAVAHGCQAGRHQEALDKVYWRRILRRGDFFSIHKLGAIGADLAALASFFEEPWLRPVSGLREADQAFVLNQAGYRLMSLGRLAEALQPLQAALEADIAQKAWRDAGTDAGNLSGLCLTLGEVIQAQDYAQQARDLAERSGDDFRRTVSRAQMAAALHQAGRLKEGEDLFRQAEEIEKVSDPGKEYLYSLVGFLYCDLLLDQGKYLEVLQRATHTLTIAQRNDWLMDIALDHLSLGRANLLMALQAGSRDLSQAAAYLYQAVAGLRQAGTQNHLPRGLLARGELHRGKGDWDQAWRDLNEALTIATRGGMKLHEADGLLEAARLYLAQDDREQARASLAKAKEMITAMGYHRRDREVRELEEQLGSG